MIETWINRQIDRQIGKYTDKDRLELTFDPIFNIGSKVSFNELKIDPMKFYRIN